MPEKSFSELNANDIPKGYAKGYKAIVPMIETQIFLPWLTNQLKNDGVQFETEIVTNLTALSHRFDIVVNCTALGAKELCNDNAIFPVRGQVILLEPNIIDYIFLDNQSPTYIVLRKDATIVGGTYEEHIFDETTNEKTLTEILNKATAIMPILKTKKEIGHWAGLRPYRETVRLEQEQNIIHNYGHGGSGFTLSFGCAEAVKKIIEENFKLQR